MQLISDVPSGSVAKIASKAAGVMAMQIKGAVTPMCNPVETGPGSKFSISITPYLKSLARPERLELPTLGFEDRYSIQLSYGRGSGRSP